MRDKEFNILLAKYLSGNTSPEEDNAFIDCINQDPEKKQAFQKSLSIWKSSLLLRQSKSSASKSWKSFNKKTVKHQQKKYFYRIAVAASILLILISAVFLAINKTKETIIEETIVLTTPVKHVLSDGSVVWLSEDSKVIIHKDFNKKDRQIILEGEAFFEIQKNKDKPFIIHTNVIETKVLGTSFNLRAYPTENSIEINVKSGVVSFSKQDESDKNLILNKSESAYYLKSENLLAKVDEEIESQHTRTHIKRSPTKPLAYEEANAEYNATSETKEFKSPLNYLMHSTSWKENFIKQTVIQGELVNQSVFTTFKNVRINIRLKKSNGKWNTHKHVIKKEIIPGQIVKYKIKLSDYFDKTDQVEINIEGADIQQQ